MALNKKIKKFIVLIIVILCLAIASPFSYSQDVSKPQKISESSVVLSGEPLFEIKAKIGSFSPEDRAKAVSQRLEAFAEDASLPIDILKLENQSDETVVLAGDKTILALVDADAKAANKNRQELTAEYLKKIKISIQEYRESRSTKSLLFSGLYAFLLTILLLIIFKVLSQILSRTLQRIDAAKGTRIPSLRIQNIEFLPATQITDILTRALKFLRLILFLGLFYLYVLLVLSLLPWTKQVGASLSSYLLKSVGGVFQAFFAYLPNLFVIALVVVLTYYILKLVQFIFTGIGRGTFSLPGFYSEWAKPTNKLVTFLIIAFAAIVAFPYLPGAKSPAFQGVSVFLGLLLSLGSSAAVANVVAGVILIYTRAFEVGDRVKVGDAIGDIVEKTLLVTRIRTIKNVVITIPNASVLSAQIINYSSAAQDPDTPPLILHTTITLGYDLPWRKVHEALINAARATAHILTEPAPFVLQTSLDDFYVSYEINAYTDNPKIMAKIYSELHQNIQDKCNEVGIEILSPHYRAMRDGNQNTIPESYLPEDYIAPGFRISSLGHFGKPPDLKPKSNGQELSES
ncbi:MAG: mechanosensitive ion channel [Leptolyngbyaceae cyanobacterium CRU_2_3]|nr:mechanosensitive ion channel [Leptolyngbyaceae cyanobacterium CRU_2_3]